MSLTCQTIIHTAQTVALAAALFIGLALLPLDPLIMPLPDPLCVLKPLTLPGPVG